MKKFILILILAAIGIAGYQFITKRGVLSPQAADGGSSEWEKGTGEPLTISSLDATNSKEFKDSTRGLSFRYPDYMDSSIFDDATGDIILVQSTEKAQGFQVLITPWDEPETTLDASMIKRDIPDLKITDPQDVLLGESGKGVAFLSDNESFGGNSREVWFIYGGNLYQISTYARLDPLLQAVLATWKFE